MEDPPSETLVKIKTEKVTCYDKKIGVIYKAVLLLGHKRISKVR